MLKLLLAAQRLIIFAILTALTLIVAPFVFGYAILTTEWLRFQGKPTNPTEARRARTREQGIAVDLRNEECSVEVPVIVVSPALVVDENDVDQSKVNGLSICG